MSDMVLLSDWANAKFGGRYTLNTLRSWARSGCITPKPEKIGRDWWVSRCANYKKPEKSVTIPDNVDIDIVPTDAVVMAILGRSRSPCKQN